MFTCERCGYCSIYKSNLKSHLNRKIICKPVVKDIGIDVLKEKINQNKKLIKNEPKMTKKRRFRNLKKFVKRPSAVFVIPYKSRLSRSSLKNAILISSDRKKEFNEFTKQKCIYSKRNEKQSIDKTQ